MPTAGYNFEGTKNFVIENSIIKGYDVPCKISHSNYGELILERMRTYPSFVGQVDGLTGRETTFAEMTEKSVKCAMWLREQNVMPGEIIAICTHNHTDMYVPCFASLYVGAVYNAWWDIGLTKELATHFVTLTEPKILFVDEASAEIAREAIKEAGAGTKIVVFGKLPGLQSLDDILAMQDSKIVPEFRCTELKSLDHPAVILYTSGSTGKPKGVLHSHRCVFNIIEENLATSNVENPNTTLIFSSLAWLAGIFIMLKGIIVPEKRVIYPTFNEESVFQLIERFKVNWLLLVSSAACRLQRSPAITKYDLSSLKDVMVGGAIWKDDKQKALAAMLPHASIHQGYGTTELGNVCVEQPTDYKSGSIGKLVKNRSLKVIDPATGEVLGPNQPGEACIKAPSMMVGYYKNPKATSETIDSEGWLHTGDLIQYDEEGHIFYIDRIKEMIKYQANHISPGMIEQVLQAHPQIIEAAVLGIPHELDDEHPIAFVVTTPGATVKREDLETLVASKLPDYMKLRGGVKFLEELPHTASGKLARSELKKLAKSYACSDFS